MWLGGLGNDLTLPADFGIERDARYVGTFTRPRVTVPHRARDAGRRATYWARWIDRRGRAGRFSNSQSVCVA